MTYGTQEMLTFLEVNGAATEASAIEREMPDWGTIMSKGAVEVTSMGSFESPTDNMQRTCSDINCTGQTK